MNTKLPVWRARTTTGLTRCDRPPGRTSPSAKCSAWPRKTDSAYRAEATRRIIGSDEGMEALESDLERGDVRLAPR